jgi:hypothetical protein
MSQLPARPDLDQLRRQARDLHRAALAGDADALRRLRQVSASVGLVTPRRTFAVVQAATRSRVDLGLRLDEESPGGRLLRQDRPGLVIPGNPWLATEPVPGDAPSARWQVPVTVRRDTDGRISPGRSSAATAPTATSAWPGATCPATARCGCSAAPSSGSWTSTRAWSRRPCAPSTDWSHASG